MHEKAGVEDEWKLTLSSRSTGSVSWKWGAEKGSAMGLQIRDWHSLVLLCRQRKSVDLRELLAVAVEAAVLGGKEVKKTTTLPAAWTGIQFIILDEKSISTASLWTINVSAPVHVQMDTKVWCELLPSPPGEDGARGKRLAGDDKEQDQGGGRRASHHGWPQVSQKDVQPHQEHFPPSHREFYRQLAVGRRLLLPIAVPKSNFIQVKLEKPDTGMCCLGGGGDGQETEGLCLA